MDFLNKLGKKASETYQATKEKATTISEELKLKGKISDLKSKIQKDYTEIGEIVYKEIKAGKDVEKEEITAKCEEISRANDEISKLETEILAVKKIKKCSNCGAELEIDAEFCSKCGKEQPKIEKVEIVEEASAKDAEVIEVKDVTTNDINESSNEESSDKDQDEN